MRPRVLNPAVGLTVPVVDDDAKMKPVGSKVPDIGRPSHGKLIYSVEISSLQDKRYLCTYILKNLLFFSEKGSNKLSLKWVGGK